MLEVKLFGELLELLLKQVSRKNHRVMSSLLRLLNLNPEHFGWIRFCNVMAPMIQGRETPHRSNKDLTHTQSGQASERQLTIIDC